MEQLKTTGADALSLSAQSMFGMEVVVQLLAGKRAREMGRDSALDMCLESWIETQGFPHAWWRVRCLWEDSLVYTEVSTGKLRGAGSAHLVYGRSSVISQIPQTRQDQPLPEDSSTRGPTIREHSSDKSMWF